MDCVQEYELVPTLNTEVMLMMWQLQLFVAMGIFSGGRKKATLFELLVQG